jgi:hypothetical protein
MNICAEIESARDCGRIHCGLSSQASPSVAGLAAEFGLSGDPCVYREIDATAAQRLVQFVLNQDMAYNAEIIPMPRAAELAERFLDQFGINGARFYTNGVFRESNDPSLTWPGASWNPATEATFDTGVLIISPTCSGCLWVEDED